MIRRRDFITLLGGAAAWPVAARAQRPAVPVVGFLDTTNAAARTSRVAAFSQALSDAGLVPGRNIAIEFRFADNQLDRMPGMLADLLRRKVDVIIAAGAFATAAKAATATTPIVFVTGADPIASGLVNSLNRPEGNITGVSFNIAPLDPKRLELLGDLVPEPAKIAALIDSVSMTQRNETVQHLETAGGVLGRRIQIIEVSREIDFDAAFANVVQSGARGLFVGAGPFFLSKRRLLTTLANRHGLAACYAERDYVEVGGLMSYGASDVEACRRAGIYVARILKGAKPTDLPVELPTKYELVLNLATAKALKIEIPAKLLAIADEAIE